MWTSRVLKGLLVVQGCALVVILARLGSRPAVEPARSLFIGDSATYLTGKTADGRPDTVTLRGQGRWTAVMVFSSSCVWCDSIAPRWREWLSAKGHDSLQVVAVANENAATAQQYAAKKGWQIRILAVPEARGLSLERALTGRTPWLYAFDPQGRLVLTRHGQFLSALDSLTAPPVVP